MRPTREGSSSPWGSVQTIEEIAEGIVSVTTAGHGGMWLSADRLARIPAELQHLNRFGVGAWFEEDCEVMIPVVAFPEVFPQADMDQISLGMNQFYGAAWTAYQERVNNA